MKFFALVCVCVCCMQKIVLEIGYHYLCWIMHNNVVNCLHSSWHIAVVCIIVNVYEIIPVHYGKGYMSAYM